MKNDIKQIKNEISNTQTQKQAKEQKKARQEALKYNLTTILQLKLVQGLSFLNILENKNDIIIETIETFKNDKKNNSTLDEFENLAKIEENVNIWLTGKEKKQVSKEENQEIDDYIYLDEIFFSIYSKIEREENKKNKLRKEENEKKLHKIITNKIEYNLEIANKKSDIAKKYIILTYKYVELKDTMIKEIKEDFKEYSNEEIAKMYDIVLKELLNKYKYTNEQEPTQQEPVKLHWVWKANIALDAINKLFKHF